MIWYFNEPSPVYVLESKHYTSNVIVFFFILESAVTSATQGPIAYKLINSHYRINSWLVFILAGVLKFPLPHPIPLGFGYLNTTFFLVILLFIFCSHKNAILSPFPTASILIPTPPIYHVPTSHSKESGIRGVG